MTSLVGGFRPLPAHAPGRTYEPNLQQRPDGRIILNGSGGGDAFDVRNLENGSYGVNVGYGQGKTRDFTFTKDQLSRLTINARGGADTIAIAPNVDVAIRVNGGAGNDQIFNGANGTRINGGAGNDLLYNAANNAILRGGAGNDILSSAGHANLISGGQGRDAISAYGNFNDIRGGRGADAIHAQGFANTIRGGRGWDNIGVVGYANLVKGGPGRDTITAYGGGNQLQGGPGRDAITAIDAGRMHALPVASSWTQGCVINPASWFGC